MIQRALRGYSKNKNRPLAVVHFAAYAYVAESVAKPLRYYRNNVTASITLLDALRAAGIDRFVFSSSCATYGFPHQRFQSMRIIRRSRSIPTGQASSWWNRCCGTVTPHMAPVSFPCAISMRPVRTRKVKSGNVTSRKLMPYRLRSARPLGRAGNLRILRN